MRKTENACKLYCDPIFILYQSDIKTHKCGSGTSLKNMALTIFIYFDHEVIIMLGLVF